MMVIIGTTTAIIAAVLPPEVNALPFFMPLHTTVFANLVH